jgi:hypothetical protein
MSALVIGANEQAAIKAAIDRARRHPVTREEIMRLAVAPSKFHVTLADRAGKRTTSSEHVLLPVGHRLSISFEEQPNAGLCLHISISHRGALPNPWAAEMIAKECGIPFSVGDADGHPGVKIWIEDFIEEGQEVGKAINLLYPMERT